METIILTPEELKRPAFHHLDKYAIVSDATGRPVQSESSLKLAFHIANILNHHNEQYGHVARYFVALIVKEIP